MPIAFPPIESASSEGLLAIGGKIEPETLRVAYHQGIFPWPISNEAPMTWFSPDPRGILEFNNFYISRSFKKFIRRTSYQVKFNENFETVIRSCAEVVRKHESSTWISEEIIQGYLKLFKEKCAYSVEVYDGEKLVGGLYGVCFGEIITGESMFHLETNASKFGLYKLVEKLSEKKISWLDTQMVSPLLESMGGINISRAEFKRRLLGLNSTSPSRSEIFSN